MRKKIIDRKQLWFWTKEWQKIEKEADQAIRKGETSTFKNVKELKKEILIAEKQIKRGQTVLWSEIKRHHKL